MAYVWTNKGPIPMETFIKTASITYSMLNQLSLQIRSMLLEYVLLSKGTVDKYDSKILQNGNSPHLINVNEMAEDKR